jgi:hypothetical protein
MMVCNFCWWFCNFLWTIFSGFVCYINPHVEGLYRGTFHLTKDVLKFSLSWLLSYYFLTLGLPYHSKEVNLDYTSRCSVGLRF